MNMVKKVACLSVIGAATSLMVVSAHAQSSSRCGPAITVADSASQGSNFSAHLDEYILRHGYGCDVTVVAGNTTLSATSIVERGQPNVISEAWVGFIREIIDPALTEGRIVLGAEILADGSAQGWYVPQYILDENPDIKTVEDALKRPDLFPSPDDPSRGAIHNGAQGWGITAITSQLYKAYEADKLGFDLIDTGSQAGLEGTIARAYERRLGWLGVYWEPNALLAKYPIVKLDSVVPVDEEEWTRCTTVPSCPDPKVGSWPITRVYTVMSSEFAGEARADILAYLNKRALHNDMENQIFLWMDENQATGEQGAVWFLQNYHEIWGSWVSEEAQAKITASLP